MKFEMKALRRFTYGTRRLTADDLFLATRQDARVLEALGHARLTGLQGETPAKPANRVKTASQPTQQPVQTPDENDQSDDDNGSSSEGSQEDEAKDPKAELVEQARSLGIDADMSWGMKRLRKEIKQAKA